MTAQMTQTKQLQLQEALVGDISNIDLNLVLTGIDCYSYTKYGLAPCSVHKLEYQWMWESCQRLGWQET